MSFGLGTYTVDVTAEEAATLEVPAGEYVLSATTSDGSEIEEIDYEDRLTGQTDSVDDGGTVVLTRPGIYRFVIYAGTDTLLVNVNVSGAWLVDGNGDMISQYKNIYDNGKAETDCHGVAKMVVGDTVGENAAVSLSQSSDDTGEVYFTDSNGDTISTAAAGDEVYVYGKTGGTVDITLTDGDSNETSATFMVIGATAGVVNETYTITGGDGTLSDFASSDTDVATVTAEGVVSFLTAGYVKISYVETYEGESINRFKWFNVTSE